jgi:tetratricopeptide (TPR) repeat protein
MIPRPLPAALGVLLLAACAAGLRAQAPPSEHTPKPRVQKLANPLNDLLEEAQKAISRQDYAAAVAPLQKLLAEQPGFADAHFQLAYALSALNRRDEARTEYERAVSLDPKLFEGWLDLGLLLLDSDPAVAVAPFDRAVALQPAQSRPRFFLGYARERAGDLAGAAAAYEGAEKLDPRDYEVAFAYGRTLLLLKRAVQAEGKFRRALDIKPDSAPARLGLANCLAAQEKPEAAAAFSSYLELRPDDRAARLDLARLLFNQKDFTGALAALDAAESGQPASADGLKLRAEVLVAQSRWDDALGIMQRILTLEPRDPTLRVRLGRVYLRKRDYASAERELKTALTLDPQSADVLRELSATYYLVGNCPAVLDVLDQLGRREEPSVGSWFVRATCYDKLERVGEALAAYRKFIELDRGRNDTQDFQAGERIKALVRKQERKNR